MRRSLAALVAGLLAFPAVASETATLPAGWSFEEIAPRVHRFLDDGAGHDIESIPNHDKWLSKLTAAPDGSPWLPDDEALLHLGSLGTVEHPIGPGALELDIERDGTVWVRNGGEIAMRAGGPASTFPTAWTVYPTDQGIPAATRMAAHPDGGVAVVYHHFDRNELLRLSARAPGERHQLARPIASEARDWRIDDLAITPDGHAWVIERRYWLEPGEREPAVLWHWDGLDWTTVEPLGPDASVEPVALSQDPRGRLTVQLAATPPREPGQRLPIAAYGEQTWLARLAPDGTWLVRPTTTNGLADRHVLVATTEGSSWLRPWPLPGTTGDCAGIVEIRDDAIEQHLDGFCVLSGAATADGNVWFAGRGHYADRERRGPGLYVIRPARG